jgi:hypothetical protein
MNIDIGRKRDEKRRARLNKIRGRVTAFGFKSYPAYVLAEMRRAKRRREKGEEMAPDAVPATGYVHSPVADVPSRKSTAKTPNLFRKAGGFIREAFIRNQGRHG